MAVRVAVVDPLPMFRHGVTAILSVDGHAVDTPDDPVAWASRRSSALVLLTLAHEADWRLLTRLCEVPEPPAVIGLIDGVPAILGPRAIRSGARSVLPRDAAAPLLRRTVEATLDGQSVMPAVVMTAVLGSAAGTTPVPTAGAEWLRELAAGRTVAQVAAQSGYSERAMFRLLRALYRQMGAGSRVEAIMRAREWGWL
ncbi:DNA-binding response regulator [Actinoplanes sp. KI2]|uniref:DNA-binding response regulator n=1 Tax=Actinoplanes sp. KI2 TaxID=2983315 RepID=UPI0021D5F1CE|nr:DNA-binding response regulator [Actinoplanes sp. KI2]MCU7730020.1 DNA-binding response regulator [Actinoplanes sp. KI2]